MRFPFSTVRHLSRIYSNHRPILLSCDDISRNRLARPFRFLAPRLGHEGFPDVLKSSWASSASFPDKLAGLTTNLKRWNKEVYGNIFQRRKDLSTQLNRLELAFEADPTERNLSTCNQIRLELEKVLWDEELLWIQKARNKWVVEGDRNTHFFHQSAIRRRAFNRIKRLRNADGVWVEEDEGLLNLAVDFFKELYTDVVSGAFPGLSSLVPRLTDEQRGSILGSFTDKEIYESIHVMGSLKAPGKDGFHPIFYQRNWSTVGPDLIRFVRDMWGRPDRIKEINETLLVLIPKLSRPTLISQFRPISLCNVTYKVVAKCLANRMKGLMQCLVHPSQTSFVPGRHITDNIIVVQEVIHSMHGKSSGKGIMVLKIDLAKAYDGVRWSFVIDTLVAMNFPASFIAVIDQCISTPTFQVQWNGGCSESFTPSRGLRQGCPLSPYLFTLCLERLSSLIQDSVRTGDWQPVSLTRGGTKLTHMFFADDLVLFGYASVQQAAIINQVLERFSEASGQEISREKSRIHFSKNVNRRASQAICEAFRMEATQNLGKYLGVPIIHGRNSKELYNFLLERMDAKLAGWKRKSLSQAGRVSLAQSVLNSLPSYVMQTTLLPVDICNKLDKKVRDFVWGSEEGERKMHLINWQKVCSPKNQGGLGLRSSREMNHALLMKLIWKMLKHPEELWVSVLMTKYFDRTSEGLRPRKSKRWSSCWKGLQETWPTFQGGLYWGIRNGRKTNFWTERWLDNGSILSEQCTPPSDRIVDKVADYCTTDGNWDLELLSSFLPNTLMEEVVGMTPPCDELEDDIPVWGLEPNGCYSVRSGYLLSIGLEDYNGMSIWKRIWRWEGPQRVRQFLWLAVNDRLLTNAERHRRHLATSTDCNLCHEVSEDVTHILRDCPPAKET
ncbi:Putative ribonuclease H protein At1g65750 [Linum perenne]